MENTEIHYEMTVANDIREWNEKITGLQSRNYDLPEPTTDAEAIYTSEKTIEFFNSTLGPGEGFRILRCVQRVETKVIDIMGYIHK